MCEDWEKSWIVRRVIDSMRLDIGLSDTAMTEHTTTVTEDDFGRD